MISKEIEEEFPIIKEINYLNIAYGSPLAKSVQKAIYDFLSNLKTKGVDKKKYFEDLDTLRKESAILLKCNPEEIAFIKNTSEGLNIAANGIPIKRGDNVVLNDLEHPNNVYPWLNLRNRGVDIRFVPSNGRRVDANDFYDYIDDNTKVVSVGSITSLGFRFDLEKLGKICEENGSYLVVDAIQSLGIEPFDVKKYGIDLLSSSCHKGLL